MKTDSKEQEKLFLSIREAAKLLGLSYSGLYAHLNEIPHVLIGSRILIKRSWIDDLVEAAK